MPVEIPEEPTDTEDTDDTKVDEESEAIVEEFPVADAVRRNCGFRSVRPQVTLYNQSPVPAPFLYHQAIAQPYIVNGVEAIPHEFPFMVGCDCAVCFCPQINISFQAALMNRNRQFCGGSLIDDNHILTAAHCVAQ